jgi:DNA-binding XRE family transcriptional regulator
MIKVIELEGKRYVILPESEYEQLCGRAGQSLQLDDNDLPPLPKPDRNGRFPAEEYTRMLIARDIVRKRKAGGLTQSELAKLAGVRQETLSRIESGKQHASVRTIEKIEKAIDRRSRGQKSEEPARRPWRGIQL